jgi:hypothetical protein
MIEVKWDASLPPHREETPVERWDRWFEAVGDKQASREWAAAKLVHGSDPAMLERWATLIEINRLDRLEENKITPAQPAARG